MPSKWLREDPEELTQDDIRNGNVCTILFNDPGGDLTIPDPSDTTVPIRCFFIAHCDTEDFDLDGATMTAGTAKAYVWGADCLAWMPLV